jgi:ribonuclease P protein component
VVGRQLTGVEQKAESVSQYKYPTKAYYMSYAYRKSERLKKNSEFSTTMKGKRLSIDGLSLFYKENTTGNYRIGISISKKIAKAVKRNQLRRQIRACLVFVLRGQKQGYDLVFIARQELMIAKHKKILQTVEKLLLQTIFKTKKTEGTPR